MRERMKFLGVSMARRSRRRWLVATTYAVLAGFVTLLWTLGRDRGEAFAFVGILLATSLVVNAVIFGGYGRWGLVKPFNTRTPFGAPVPWHNDERERNRRDRMHFYAYRVVVPLLLFGYFLGRDPFQIPEVSRALFLTALVLGLTLPQALLLWIEPDMEFDEAVHGI